MNTASKLAICVAILLINSGCGGSDVDELGVIQDIVASAPDNAGLLFENEYVTVVEIELESGDRLPTWECGDHTVYSLSSYEMEVKSGSESAREKFNQGSAFWREAGTYSLKNVGRSDARYIIVTRKTAEFPDFKPLDPDGDIIAVAWDNSIVLLNNETLRVAEVILNPGQRLPGHSSVNRIVYSLTSYEMTCRFDQIERSDIGFEEGDVNWYAAGPCSMVNNSDSPARFVVFEFLR